MPPAVPTLRGARASLRGRLSPIRLPERASPTLTPRQLEKAKAKLSHASAGHRELAAHHRAEAEKAETLEERETHEAMAKTHEQAAGDHDAKAAALK